ncbi:MAG: NADH-quinone oxidoreductase subunit C [Verrucomicrobiota bacterium]
MIENQTILPLGAEALVERVQQMRDQGWRLVHIGGTTLADHIQLDYAFDREGQYTAFRVTAIGQGPLPSISGIYWCAFIYENELHDLFDLTITGMAVDFKGNLYKTMVPHPFACPTPVSVSVAAKA